MLCVAALKALVLQVAVLLLPLPVSAIALQPLMELAPSLKLTLPVGLLPATVAVNVTLVPTVDGFFELARRRRTAAPVCDDLRQRAAGRDIADVAAVPGADAVRADGQGAGRACCGLAVAAAGELQGRTTGDGVDDCRVKLTLPIGVAPVTVAVKVTLGSEVRRIARAHHRCGAQNLADRLSQHTAARGGIACIAAVGSRDVVRTCAQRAARARCRSVVAAAR